MSTAEMTIASNSDASMGPALHSCLVRLEEVLDLETVALTDRRDEDLQECSRRKSRALLELTRIARTIPATALETGARRGIARVREKLMRNRDLLQIHINVVREVANLLTRSIAERESDGTYSGRPSMHRQ